MNQQASDQNMDATSCLETMPVTATGQDMVKLSQYLEQVKAQYPDKTSATLLVAEDVDYDTIVQVMDAVRVRQSTDGGKVVRRELFPQIALGDAPI